MQFFFHSYRFILKQGLRISSFSKGKVWLVLPKKKPLFVQCWFFNPINCVHSHYFSHGYATFKTLIFSLEKFEIIMCIEIFATLLGEELKISKMILKLILKNIAMTCNLWKALHLLVFKPYSNFVCLTDIHPPDSHRLWLEGWFPNRWAISSPEHNIWLFFAIYLNFTWFHLLTGRMHLKSRLPSVVQGWFFVPINYNLGYYFSRGYAIFSMPTF